MTQDPTTTQDQDPTTEIRLKTRAAIWISIAAGVMGIIMIVRATVDVAEGWPVFNAGLCLVIISAVFFALASLLEAAQRILSYIQAEIAQIRTAQATQTTEIACAVDRVAGGVSAQTGVVREILSGGLAKRGLYNIERTPPGGSPAHRA